MKDAAGTRTSERANRREATGPKGEGRDSPSTFPKYPEYKDSGVEWLGEVPAHWEIVRNKRMFHMVNLPVGKSASKHQLLSLTLRGVLPRRLDGKGKYPAEFDTYQIVQPGNVIFCLFDIDETPRTVGHSDLHGMITGAYSVAEMLPKAHSRFVYYYYYYIDLRKGLRPFYTGLRKVVRPETFSNLEMPCPPVQEQTAISAFLDHETARIDALVEEQQRLIELLKEKRQAVISHAVTKGLDPDVPMKDSGVEWLGEVPAHWDVVPLKFIVSTPVTDGPHETPEFIDDGVPFVSAEAVSSGRIDFDKARFIRREDHERFSKKYSPKKHDVYMVKSGATTGITAIVEDDRDFNIWSPLAVIRCKDGMDPYFVLHSMRSTNFQESVVLNWSYGTQQNIGMGVIENLPIAMPPENEQKEISTFLSGHVKNWEVLIQEASRTVSLLQERRSALISAAVTGKIDVRGWQPPAGSSVTADTTQTELV